jgi:hypothetical protein
MVLLACAPCLAKEPAAESKDEAAESSTKFLRLSRDEDGDLVSMDTAIVRFGPADENKQGPIVDLIGVVHIGEKSYYKQLNKEFEQYDALLYELVAPEDKTVPRGGEGSGHPIGALQTGMKDMLELEFQLSHINYSRNNFVHADMSPEAFSKSMTDRGESFWQILLRSMGQGIAMESRNRGKSASGTSMLMAWFSPNRAMLLKRMMAQQFEDLETSMKTLDGPDGSTIISERNKVALKVLSEQIAAGKQRIGIFYGAGHMPDMQRRLLDDFGLKPQSQRWLVAWDLKGKSKPSSSERNGSSPSQGSDQAKSQ